MTSSKYTTFDREAMRELSAIKYVEKRSKFYAHLYEIGTSEDIDAILKKHRRNYKKAVHHCWAFRVKGNEKFKNDGEVGHPGKVLLELLVSEGLDHHALVVSRIFGGVKLGVGGVSRSFRESGRVVLKQSGQPK